MLDDGAIDDDGAGAGALLELPEEAVSLPLHAVSESAATAAMPIPATRSLVTKITPKKAAVNFFLRGIRNYRENGWAPDQVMWVTAP
ncbi:hypothetical protein ACWEVP_19280 [Amycolatopsis sp. NPDC003865]